MPGPDLRAPLQLVLRFAAAGVANTLLGLAVILALDIGFSVRPAIANAIGYVVGISVSWLLHRNFVFRSQQTGLGVKARYLVAVACAFGLNQLVLQGAQALIGDEAPARILSQLASVATYSVVQFVLLKTWVFSTRDDG